MLNIIWLALMIAAVCIGAINGTLTEVVNSITTAAKTTVELALTLLGVLAFWLGIMQIAQDAGLVKRFTHLVAPLMRRLFPEVPGDHPAMGAIVLNISANMLGLNNAATPFGLKAMHELQSLNRYPKIASNPMVTFLAINTSSVQLIPASGIAMLAAGGAHNPTIIITTSLLATSISTLTAIVMVKWFEKMRLFKINNRTDSDDDFTLQTETP